MKLISRKGIKMTDKKIKNAINRKSYHNNLEYERARARKKSQAKVELELNALKEILSIKFTRILRDARLHKTIRKKVGFGEIIKLEVFGNIDKEVNRLIDTAIEVLRPRKRINIINKQRS